MDPAVDDVKTKLPKVAKVNYVLMRVAWAIIEYELRSLERVFVNCGNQSPTYITVFCTI